MSSPGRILIEIDPTDLGLAWLVPRTFFFAVELGITMMPAWSWPPELWRLRSRPPVTVKGGRARVVLRDRELAPGAEANAARGDAARQRDDEVRPQALDLLGDPRLGARAHADHRDDGGDTDDDAEHREGAPERVDAQRADGDANALPDAHASSSSTGSEARTRSASRGDATRSSPRSRPSLKERIRPA